MSDHRVLVPLPDGRWLALPPEVFYQALEAGTVLSGASAPAVARLDEPLLEAEKLAELLNIPASWIEQKALEGVIPSLRFGRWRRFKRSEVEAAVRASRESA